MARFFKLLLGALALLAALFFLYTYRTPIVRTLSGAATAVKNFSSDNADRRKIIELEAKNQILSLELERTASTNSLPKDERYHYKTARVHSRYPFNDASLVVIDLGSDDGIREQMPVFVEKGVLFGKVRKVRRTTSEVESIWSAGWRMSVAIGESGTKAVYIGGDKPSLDLVPKEAKISAGDAVISTSPDAPLGSFVGKVSEVSNNSYDVWQRASVIPAFDAGEFSTVFVLVDFP